MKDVSKNKLFIFWGIFFLIWIFLNNILLNLKLSLILALLVLYLLINFYFYTKKNLIFLIFIFFSFLLWILYSFYYSQTFLEKEKILKNFIDDKKHKIIFKINDINKKLDFEIDYIWKIISIDNKKINKKIFILIKIPRNYDIEKGNIIEINEKIKEIKNFSDSFDYKNFLLSKNIFLVFKPINFYFLDSVSDSEKKGLIEKFNKKLQNFRQDFINVVHKIYPEKQAIFLAWILIWAREEIPKDLKNNFNNSGLTHLIAVSWFNITIIVLFLSFIFKFFPIFLRVFLVIFSIVIFTLIVWLNPAVVRASIMWILAYLIISSWRKWDSLAILIFTAIIMVLFNPLILNYDISFHLSFLAVLWLLYTQKFWEKVFYFLPEKFAIKESFVLTLSAFSFTIPIIIFNFWRISILAPIANMLVWWVIPFAMLFWFIAVLLYFINPILWIYFWVIDYIFLKYVILIVEFFWSLEFSILKVNFSHYSKFLEILYFLILVFLILFYRKKANTF
jgi:competence protein ComEC